MAKASLILMSPVYFIKSDNFAYPELHFVVNEKNGTFSYQKNVLLPYSWLHLIDPLTPTDLKNFKSSKIKNRSIIEEGIFKKFQL